MGFQKNLTEMYDTEMYGCKEQTLAEPPWQ